MPTANIPLTYAYRSGDTIHLHVLIYAGSQPDFEDGEASGNTMLFPIEKGSAGTTKFFKHYSFDVDSFTNIEVRCDGHVRKIAIADVETDTAPAQTGDQAHEVPYVYTQIVNTNSFKAELVIFAPATSTLRYVCTHSTSGDDTESSIGTNTQATPVSEFSDSHTFTVQNVLNTNGAHEASAMVGDPPKKRKSKTKNRNHSQTPFPRRRRNRIS